MSIKYLSFILFSLIILAIFYKQSKTENDSIDPILTYKQKIWIQKKLASMTLREKIAQMIISSTFGADYDTNSSEFSRLQELCKVQKIGGFIFFKGTSTGYARLSNKLQELSETPLLFSADFERGTGMRVTDGTLFPNNMAIGAAGNPGLAYKMGLVIAQESRSLGIHQNYAPVCDVNNNPNNPIINVRSFGEDPNLVSQMSEMIIKGLQEGHMIATAKHFPGHGDTEIDSHKDLPQLNFTMERLNKLELVPFKNAIEKNVMSVMIAHLSFPELEYRPNVPASLSENIVKGLLIDKLGFNGLIITDALNMQGITKYFSASQVAVMCVKAGIDLILMPLDEKATIEAIEQAVSNGEITEERINISAEKIFKAKAWLGLNENKFVNDVDVYKVINTPSSNELAQQIADESITLVKDDKNVIPLKKSNGNILVFNISNGADNINSDYFSNKISSTYPGAAIIDIIGELEEKSIGKLLQTAGDYEYIILSIYSKVKYGTGKISILSSHKELIDSLNSINKNLITISFGNPYLLKEFSNIPCYICAYGDADVSINAAIKAISGIIKIKGKLPVTITENYRIGSGIER